MPFRSAARRFTVARGWESKSVEAQIEEEEDNRAYDSARAGVTADNRVRQQRIDSLRLSRSRLLQQLERAAHAAHREVLMRGLKAIEKELEDIPPAEIHQ